MIKIWDIVKKEIVLLFILFTIIAIVVSIYEEPSKAVPEIVLSILSLILIIEEIIKYNSLKKNGVLLENIPYSFKDPSKDSKVMVIDLDYENKHYTLYRSDKYVDKLTNNGITNVVINPKNEKVYYVFLPKQ